MTASLQHAALAIAAVIIDSLWQGALIAGAAWIGLRCFPQLGASTRYAIWLCTLMALVLTPLFTVAAGGHGSSVNAPAAVTSARESVSDAPRAQPRAVAEPSARQPANVPAQPAAAAIEPLPRAARAQLEISAAVALSIALAWLLAACARGVMLIADLRELISVRRRARAWSTAYAYPVLQSDRVAVPIAIGFARPAVVLPTDLVERLDTDALDAIVTHEIAHLQRYDVWTNAIARIAQALLVLNPAAWFVMRRLAVEREIACDDWVINRTGTGEPLAQTLLAMATDSSRRIPMGAPSAFGSRHAIVVRIERLLDARPRRLRLSPVAFAGALMALALIALVIGSISPVLAYAPVQDLPAQLSLAASSAGTCAVPNRGIAFSFMMNKVIHGGPARREAMAVPSARTALAHFGGAKVALVDLTVDAAGKPRKVVVISPPLYPGMAEHLTRSLMSFSYEPALRDCVPIATTMRAGLPISRPERNTASVIVPVYPAGWSAAHQSVCKVPTVTHARFRAGFVAGTPYTQMLPAFPGAMKDIGIDEKFRTTVRVHVNASGAATSAAIERASGRPLFDEATLAAARRATYPLTTTTCKPLPNEYVWTTTFETQAFP
jgi:TonB family protein